jgi:serine/threonine-protein kinase HipA
MRNYGFLRDAQGWKLAPSFDVNPTPGDQAKYLNTSIDYDINEASVAAAIKAADYFRVSAAEALEFAGKMSSTLKSWEKVARANGISKGSINNMATCFESGIAALDAVEAQLYTQTI